MGARWFFFLPDSESGLLDLVPLNRLYGILKYL